MNELAEGAVGVAMVGVGQAVTDEAVEALAANYGVDKGFMVHLLIEAGVPIAAGVGAHYLTDNQQARNVGVGMIAAGSVNGARILVQKLKTWWENRQSDSGTGDGTTAGLAQLPPARRREIARRMAAQQNGQQRREQEREEEPRSSGTLGRSRNRNLTAV